MTENHGKRIAVIENEFGEVGIDDALVIKTDEEVFEMNNGCICCTVRGDLIRILNKLAMRRDKFDYVLVETTGLADPAPVAQVFFSSYPSISIPILTSPLIFFKKRPFLLMNKSKICSN